MKRLLTSITLALGFHALILSADFNWLKVAPLPALKSGSMAIVLSTVKSRPYRSEADFLRIKHTTPDKITAPDKLAEKQPVPDPGKKSPANAAGVKNSASIRNKQNLKKSALNKQPVRNVEPIDAASIDRRQSGRVAEAKISSPLNSGTNTPVLPSPTESALIKKTAISPGGFSEPLTTAAAAPSMETGEILPEPQGIQSFGPRYKQNSPPGYPLHARRMGYEGLVMLKVLVGANGRVDDLELLQSSGYAVLDQAALSCVKKWVFEPGTEGGKKQKMWVKIPVRFELE